MVPVVCDGSVEMKVAILEKKKKLFKLSSKVMQKLWTTVPVVCDRSVEVKVAILEKNTYTEFKINAGIVGNGPCSMR